MATTVQKIVDRVRSQLVDEATDKRWTDAELIRWTSDAQRTLVSALPSAAPKNATMSLASGAKQTIPSDGLALITVYRNTSGAAISPVPREILDIQNPSWPLTTASATIKVFTHDPNDPTTFYVYPPASGASVELAYSVLPPEVTSTSDNLSVRDNCIGAIVDYVMYRAHMKDGDFAAGMETANSYLAGFTGFIAAQRG